MAAPGSPYVTVSQNYNYTKSLQIYNILERFGGFLVTFFCVKNLHSTHTMCYRDRVVDSRTDPLERLI